MRRNELRGIIATLAAALIYFGAGGLWGSSAAELALGLTFLALLGISS